MFVLTEDRQKIRDYLSHDGQYVSLHTLECFVGMLQTGEFNVDDFAAEGVDLEQIARRFGSANCWTGTSGTLAARLLGFIEEHKKAKPTTTNEQ